MTSRTDHPTALEPYLRELSRELRPLPRWHRREIVAGIRSHVSEQGHHGGFVPAQLGTPSDIARAAKEEFEVTQRAGSRAAPVLLWIATGLTIVPLLVAFATAPSLLDLWGSAVLPVVVTLTAALIHGGRPSAGWWAGSALLTLAATESLLAVTAHGFTFPLTMLMASPAQIGVSVVAAGLAFAAAIVQVLADRRATAATTAH